METDTVPTLTIQVDSQPAPFTTQMRRFDKGVEQFYYALLLTGEKRYLANSSTWRAWFDMGFHVQSRSHPPGVEAADRIAISIRPDGKTTHIALTSDNGAALGRLQQLLSAMEAQRPALQGASDAERLHKLLSGEAVSKQLLAPVGDALKRAEFRSTEAQTVKNALERGLSAYADDEITGVKLSLS